MDRRQFYTDLNRYTHNFSLPLKAEGFRGPDMAESQRAIIIKKS